MSVSLESLGIDRLSVEDRLSLVHAIWDSIAASNRQPSLDEHLAAELDRRLADDDSNPDDVVSWEDTRAALLDRLKQ